MAETGLDPQKYLDKYYTYDELTAALEQLAEKYPHLAKLESIGKSYEGRELWVMTITNFATGPAEEKPAYWIDANIHSAEITGGATALYTIAYLLANYGQDDPKLAQVNRLLDSRAFYIEPRHTPDGVERVLTTPRRLRSSTRPYPADDDKDGLYPDDLDGDGVIRQMRVQDPNGDWKVSNQDPRLMRKRLPDEDGGVYYRLYTEGQLRNFDGYNIKVPAPKEGLDLNRNYGHDWQPDNAQLGAGPYPLSEPETRAVTDFWVKHRNICGSQSYHTFAGVILRPYSALSDDAFPKEDLEFYKLMGKRGTAFSGYPDASIFHGFRYDPKTVLHGAFLDWAYEHQGVFAISTELWDIIKLSGIEKRDFIDFMSRDRSEEDDLKIFRWADENIPGLFMNWTAFDHPQLGAVEIGGWDFVYSWQNPPPGSKWLRELAQANMEYSFACAGMSPCLTLPTLTAEKVADESDKAVYKITAVVENSGYLPTYVSKKALERKILKPLSVEIEPGAGVELISGLKKQEVGHLEGRSNKGSISPFQVGFSSDYRSKVEWVVRAAPATTVTVTANSERGGKVRQQIGL